MSTRHDLITTTRTEIALSTTLSAEQSIPCGCIAAWLTIDTEVDLTVRYDDDADRDELLSSVTGWSLYPSGETTFPEGAAIGVKFAIGTSTAKAVLHVRQYA
jgi:hypothetical protein